MAHVLRIGQALARAGPGADAAWRPLPGYLRRLGAAANDDAPLGMRIFRHLVLPWMQLCLLMRPEQAAGPLGTVLLSCMGQRTCCVPVSQHPVPSDR